MRRLIPTGDAARPVEFAQDAQPTPAPGEVLIKVEVFAMDGPGQGVLIDALGTESVGLVGLSLGGYYVAESAARETRVAAVVTVSGPFRLTGTSCHPPYGTSSSNAPAEKKRPVASPARWTCPPFAPKITCPLLVVDGGQDVIPGVTNGEPLARLASRGQYLHLPHGDHLLGNARPDWLAAVADRLSGALT
ncbi:alpha/beta fold hydrolase [Nonomuraea sp. NPDC059194]|uniref:alpha/beta fold hydrolase n=1 Tax=Nonomuraea sp. NPDC059194 TaxID=3346764 RepID=UPI00368E1F7F